jgi:hypothetical protein
MTNRDREQCSVYLEKLLKMLKEWGIYWVARGFMLDKKTEALVNE